MFLRTALSFLAVACAWAGLAAAQSLGIGDAAPKLRVGGWVKGERVESFEPERVYVVEFWATWCVPCRRSIPELTAIQSRFAPQGVRVVGVSIWEDDPAQVAPYVAELGDAMSYSVATDKVVDGATPEQGIMALSWMRAAGEYAIPTAFIVDRAGKIAWIGETTALTEPLEQILAGTWDMEAAKAVQNKRVALRNLSRKLTQLIKAREHVAALAVIDEMYRLSPRSELETAAWRFKLLTELDRTEEAYLYARKVTALPDGAVHDDALQLNLIAWFIVDPQNERKPARDLDFALQIATRAVELTESRNAAILDTLALVYFERGDLERALELQERAVELANGPEELVRDLRARLEQYRAARKRPLVVQGPIENR